MVIFYDEPTSGLDPEHAEQIQDLIRDVHHARPDVGCRRTSLIVTHDVRLIDRHQPRVVMLHNGAVFFDGSAAEFEAFDSPTTRPYREMMPLLHRRPAAAERRDRLP